MAQAPHLQGPQLFHGYDEISPELEKQRETKELQNAFEVVDCIPIISTLVNLVLLGIAAGYSIHDQIFKAPAPDESSPLRRYVLEKKSSKEYLVGLTPFAGIAAYAVQSVRGAHPRAPVVGLCQATVAIDQTYAEGKPGGNCDHIVAMEGGGLMHLDGVGHNNPRVAEEEHPLVDHFAHEWGEWMRAFDFKALHALGHFMQEAQNRFIAFSNERMEPVIANRKEQFLAYSEGPMQQQLESLTTEEAWTQEEFVALRGQVDMGALESQLARIRGGAFNLGHGSEARQGNWINVYMALLDGNYELFEEFRAVLAAQYRELKAGDLEANTWKAIEREMKELIEECYLPLHRGLLQQRLAFLANPNMSVEAFNALRLSLDTSQLQRKAAVRQTELEALDNDLTDEERVMIEDWMHVYRALADGDYQEFMAHWVGLAQDYVNFKQAFRNERGPLQFAEENLKQLVDCYNEQPSRDKAGSAFAITQPLPIDEGYIFFRNIADTCLMVLSPAAGYHQIMLNPDNSIDLESISVQWIVETEAKWDALQINNGVNLLGPFPKGAVAISFSDGFGEFLTKEEMTRCVAMHLSKGAASVQEELIQEVENHAVGDDGRQLRDPNRIRASASDGASCKNLNPNDPSYHDDVSIGIAYLPATNGLSPLAVAREFVLVN